jgi:molybdopterin converting factor small subunit
MNISVELFGQLAPSQQRRQELDLPLPATAREAAMLLGLDVDAIGLITINGVQSEMEDHLPEGCRLCFFPYVSGG